MPPMKLKGPLGAALTPLRDDNAMGGAIDGAGFARHCRWLLENGCTGVAVFGTTGEAECFTNEERMAALDDLLDRGVDAARLMVGTGRASAADTAVLTRHAVARGCAGVLVLPPFYYKDAREEGLYRAYASVIESVGGPFHLYLYHFPEMSGVPIAHDLIARLRRGFPDHVAGLKDSSGELQSTAGFAGIGEGFDVFTGDDHLLGPMLERGGAGSITATANLAPHLLRAVYDGWAARTEDAIAAHRMLEAIWVDGLLKVPVTEALKEYLAETTGARRWLNMRPPLTRLCEDERRALFAAFAAAGFRILDSQKDTLKEAGA